ncbi:MAG: serine hydrolase domain-containing protein, partial [Longimicrobiales bacterium]
GYAVEDSVLMNDEPLSMNLPGAAGALCSTARDLVHWNAALVAGDVVSPASYATMTAPTTLSDSSVQQYGYGLAPGMRGDHPVIRHSGGINGFSAFMAYYPADALTIVVLANGPTSTTDVEAKIAQRVLGLSAERD